jgi:hypothetical protein
MGILVMAYLGYGIHLSDEKFDDLPWAVVESEGGDDEDTDEDDPAGEKPDFEEWVTSLAGLTDPSAHITDRNEGWKEWYEGDSANKEAMSAFWKARQETVDNCPIGVIDVSTGESSEPCIILAVKPTISGASWAEPKPAATTLDDGALVAAKNFCEQHGIPFENPQWLLVAEYGG